MGTGTIAFLLGDLWVQRLASLPDLRWFLPAAALLPLARYLPVLRLPAWFAAGLLWALLQGACALQHTLDPALEGRDLWIEGRVATIPQGDGRRVRFDFDVARLTLDGEDRRAPPRVRLSWYGRPGPLRVGERWRLQVRLKRPHGFRNPGAFDYEGWLFQQRLGATGYVRSRADHRRLDAGRWSYAVGRLRQRLYDALTARLDGSPMRGPLVGLALGERGLISAEQWAVLTRTGTNHLLAISGLHVGLVAGLAFFLGRWLWSLPAYTLLRVPAPRVGAGLAVLAAAGYAALAGFSVPTQRALIMVAAAMLALLVGRRVRPSHTLALALLLVMVWDPLSILSPGFWLSFGAVAVILYGMGGRPGRNGLWWKWGRVQWLVTIGLLPLLLALFQRAAPWAPLANLVAVPWVGLLVLPLTLAGALLLQIVPALGSIALDLAGAALGALWAILQELAQAPLALWSGAAAPLWALGAGLLGAGLWLAPAGFPGRWLGAVGLLPLFLLPAPRPAPGEAWLTMLDVGTGLCAVLVTHDHALVFDTGPRLGTDSDAGTAVLLPFLRRAGIGRLDVLVISHGDSDHSGGSRSLLDGVPVERVLVGGTLELPGAERCREGQTWRWDGVAFRILHPGPGAPAGDNDGSCVLRVETTGGSLLLPGDIGKRSEAYLVRNLRGQLPSTVLVAPHHGSLGSSSEDFVAAVRPRLVLFAAGYRDRFGFPKPAVVARYQGLGATVYDSARHGAISLSLGSPVAVLTPSLYRETARRYWHWREVSPALTVSGTP